PGAPGTCRQNSSALTSTRQSRVLMIRGQDRFRDIAAGGSVESGQSGILELSAGPAAGAGSLGLPRIRPSARAAPADRPSLPPLTMFGARRSAQRARRNTTAVSAPPPTDSL